MRRTLLLGFVVLALAACGGASAAKPLQVEFGMSGGNIRPQRFSVTVNGNLASELRSAFALDGVTNRNCPATLPDMASEYIRVDGRTVTVHGECEPPFQRLVQKLYGLAGAHG